MKAVGKRFEIIRFSEKWSKKKPVNALVYRLCGGELGIRTLGSLWEHSISSAAPSTSRTTLRVFISIRFFFAQISVKNFLERKAGENTEKYSIFNFENPYKWGISDRRNAMKISCHIGFIFKNDNIVNYINFQDNCQAKKRKII